MAASGVNIARRALVRVDCARLRQGFGGARRSAFGAKAAEQAEAGGGNRHCRPSEKQSAILIEIGSHAIHLIEQSVNIDSAPRDGDDALPRRPVSEHAQYCLDQRSDLKPARTSRGGPRARSRERLPGTMSALI